MPRANSSPARRQQHDKQHTINQTQHLGADTTSDVLYSRDSNVYPWMPYRYSNVIQLALECTAYCCCSTACILECLIAELSLWQ